MKEPREDDERLSALLEGRVDGRQREEMLAHLAASGDDYEVFTDTAAVLRALEEKDAGAAEPAPTVPPLAETAVIPLRRPRRGWRAPAGLAMAAAVAGVVLVSALVLQRRASAEGPVQLAARVDAGREGLPAGWMDRRTLSSSRGGGSSANRQAQAAEAGALLVDLSVAVRAGNVQETRLLALQVHSRVEPEARASPLREISARAAAPPDSLAPLLDRATEHVADRHRRERQWLEIGAWTEAALLAADQRKNEFFRDRDMLRRAERLTRDDSGAQAAIVQINHALPADADGAPEWTPLYEALQALLRAITS